MRILHGNEIPFFQHLKFSWSLPVKPVPGVRIAELLQDRFERCS